MKEKQVLGIVDCRSAIAQIKKQVTEILNSKDLLCGEIKWDQLTNTMDAKFVLDGAEAIEVIHRSWVVDVLGEVFQNPDYSEAFEDSDVALDHYQELLKQS